MGLFLHQYMFMYRDFEKEALYTDGCQELTTRVLPPCPCDGTCTGVMLLVPKSKSQKGFQRIVTQHYQMLMNESVNNKCILHRKAKHGSKKTQTKI